MLVAISVSNGLPERAMDGSASIKEILPLLKQADDNFQKAILAILNKGDVSDVRDSFISSAMIRVFQTALGSSTASDPAFLAMCLGKCYEAHEHDLILLFQIAPALSLSVERCLRLSMASWLPVQPVTILNGRA
jgi:hypothetical protein